MQSVRRVLVLLIVLLPALARPDAAGAQEVGVPLDTAGTLAEMDAALARRLDLFQDYPGLVTVRLFRTGAGAHVLEVTTTRDGALVRRRLPMTDDEVAELRAEVSARLAARAPRAMLDQSGRHLLVGTTTLMGLGFYGLLLPSILDVADGRGEVATWLLTAGGSFLLPYTLTSTRPVTWGMANLSGWGMTRGAVHGLLLHQLLEGEEEIDYTPYDRWDPYVYTPSDDYERTQQAVAVGLSLVEGVAGYLWADAAEMDAGTAHTIGNAADFGLLWGAELAFIAGSSLDVADRLSRATMLGGAALGLVLGPTYAAARDFTWGDADILMGAHAVGFSLGVAGNYLVNLETDSPHLGGLLLLLGSGTMTAVGDHILRDRDFSVGQGALVNLGAVAGGLIGLGLGTLVEDRSSEGRLTVTLGALGAAIGFGGTFSALADDATWDRDRRDPTLRLEVSPLGLLRTLGPRTPSTATGRAASGPLLGLRLTF